MQKYPWSYSNIGQYCTRYDSNYFAWEIVYLDGAKLPSTMTVFGMGYLNGGIRPNRTFGTYVEAYGPVSLSSIPVGFSGTVPTTRTTYMIEAPSETAYSGGHDWKVDNTIQANVYDVTHTLTSGKYGSIKFQIQSKGGGWIEFSY